MEVERGDEVSLMRNGEGSKMMWMLLDLFL